MADLFAALCAPQKATGGGSRPPQNTVWDCAQCSNGRSKTSAEVQPAKFMVPPEDGNRGSGASVALRDQYAGIGGSFQPGPMGDGIFVKAVHPGGPLALSGKVNTGDELVAIMGQPVAGMSPKQFAGTLIGPIGSKVTVSIRRGNEDSFDVNLIRSSTRAVSAQAAVPQFSEHGAPS